MKLDSLGASVKLAAESVSPLKWLTPRDLPVVRREMGQALERDGSRIGEWAYDDQDFASAQHLIEDAESELARSTRDSDLNDLVARTLSRLGDACSSIASRDDEIFVDWDRRTHGRSSTDELATAVTQASEPTLNAPAGKMFTSEEVAAVIRETLDGLDLKFWAVEMRPNTASRMAVHPLTRKVRVQADITFSESQLRRLIVHEVGSHVLRAANSQEQAEELASVSLGESQPTEEGLAVWAEVQMGVSDREIMRGYAARTLAVDLSASLGIVDVARILEEYVDRSTAISIAIRAKRGLRDPNAPGGFSKDRAYWSGYRSIDNHLKLNPDDYPLLMATKWPLEELKLVQKLARAGSISNGMRTPMATDLLAGWPDF